MPFELQPRQAQTAVSLMPRNIAECLSELVLVQQKKAPSIYLNGALIIGKNQTTYWQQRNRLWQLIYL